MEDHRDGSTDTTVPAAKSTKPSPDDIVTRTAPDASPPRLVRPEPRKRLGRYQLLFELARGGMGTVHVGRLLGAHGFDRLVAIKLLSDTKRGEADLRAFLSEARVTARIDHPNVVQTLELGEDGGTPFIVMELLRGVSLSTLLRELRARKRPLPPTLAAWIVARAAAGLHAAHELKSVEGKPLALVHRDVSPQNILLSYGGRVAVADFGIAKLADNDPTRSGVVKGKFSYMSPEQARAAPLDRRSDIFALGVVLHESLTGKRLFASDSPLETLRRVVSEDVQPPHETNDGIPAAISRIAMRALSKAADARYATAADMANELADAIEASGARVDDASCSALVCELFADQRERFERELSQARKAAPLMSKDSEPPTKQLVVTDQASAMTHTIDHGAGSASRLLWPALALTALAGALGVGSYLWSDARPHAPAEAAASSVDAPASATSDAVASALPSETSSANAPEDGAASASAPTTATTRPKTAAKPPTLVPAPRPHAPRPKAPPPGEGDDELFNRIGPSKR